MESQKIAPCLLKARSESTLEASIFSIINYYYYYVQSHGAGMASLCGNIPVAFPKPWDIFQGPCAKDYRILGSRLGSPYLGKLPFRPGRLYEITSVLDPMIPGSM